MKFDKSNNTIFAENRSDKEAEILFNFVDLLRALKLAHHNYFDHDKPLIKIGVRYNKKDLKEELKIFRDKGLI